jgi:hypothetical protein
MPGFGLMAFSSYATSSNALLANQIATTKESLEMSEADIAAYERAVGLVGVEVCEKLSDTTRSQMLDEELARLAAEQLESSRAIQT